MPPEQAGPPSSLPERLSEALESSLRFKVEVSDHLGEGGWDADPRYPEDVLNCWTWLQWVLASSYASEGVTVHQALDALRYYDGKVSFSTRKHFVDRWVMLEPGPLVPLQGETCRQGSSQTVVLDLPAFRDRAGYGCPLHQEDLHRFVVRSIEGPAFVECAGSLPPGHYVVFPVALPAYLERWDSPSPMAMVHSMVLEVGSSGPVLWHASIDYGGVARETPAAFWSRLDGLIDGFALFSLDPDWRPGPSTVVSECPRATPARKE